MAEAVKGVDFVPALDHNEKIDSLLDRAPDQIKQRYAGLVQEARDAEGRRLQRSHEADDLRAERDSLQTRVNMLELEERRSGLIFARSTSTTDPKTGQVTEERVRDPFLAKAKARIETIKALLVEITESKRAPNELGRVRHAMERLPKDHEFVVEDLPALPEPKTSAEHQYKLDYARLMEMQRDLKALFELPRTLEEIQSGIAAEVAELAKKGEPRLSGYARGHGQFGLAPVVQTTPRIGWPTVPVIQTDGIAAPLVAIDTAALFCWLHKDALTSELLAAAAMQFDNPKAMSAADKVKAVTKLEADVWHQRVVTELRFMAARDAGSKLLRPPASPVEVILGCKAWGLRP